MTFEGGNRNSNDKLSNQRSIHTENVSAISADFSVTVLSKLAVLNDRDSVISPGLDHPVHLLPLTGERVELQDVIRAGGTDTTA